MRLRIKKIVAFVTFLISGCGGVNSVYYDGRECVSGLSTATTPEALYTVSCASCHQPLANSTKKGIGVSASTISVAIAQNKGGMSFLSCLTQTQIQAIADVLQ